jgi:ribosomal protein S6
MFIFPKDLNNDDFEEALTGVRDEIERTGGEVKSITRLGKRPFARPMKKQDAGHFAVIVFELDGSKISILHGRFNLNEKVLRVQFIRVEDQDVDAGMNEPAQEAEVTA